MNSNQSSCTWDSNSNQSQALNASNQWDTADFYQIVASVNVAACVHGALSNALLLAVVFRNRKAPLNFFITGLALSELCTCSFALLFMAPVALGRLLSVRSDVCFALSAPCLFSIYFTGGAMLCLALDRYHAIRYFETYAARVGRVGRGWAFAFPAALGVIGLSVNAATLRAQELLPACYATALNKGPGQAVFGAASFGTLLGSLALYGALLRHMALGVVRCGECHQRPAHDALGRCRCERNRAVILTLAYVVAANIAGRILAISWVTFVLQSGLWSGEWLQATVFLAAIPAFVAGGSNCYILMLRTKSYRRGLRVLLGRGDAAVAPAPHAHPPTSSHPARSQN